MQYFSPSSDTLSAFFPPSFKDAWLCHVMYNRHCTSAQPTTNHSVSTRHTQHTRATKRQKNHSKTQFNPKDFKNIAATNGKKITMRAVGIEPTRAMPIAVQEILDVTSTFLNTTP